MTSSAFYSQFEKLSFPLMGLVQFPKVKIEPSEYHELELTTAASNVQYLKKLAWKGYLAKEAKGLFPHCPRQQAIDRLKLEFDVFEKTGTVDYILIVQRILRYCDDNNIPRGPSRGSCGASFAFYCLGITTVDPIRFNLTFTRFISEARVKPRVIDGKVYADGKMVMDVDIDVGFVERERVIQYIHDTYHEAVCYISNRITLSPKIALKDVLKIYLAYSEEEAKMVSDNVEIVFGKSKTLEESLKDQIRFKDWYNNSPKNKEAYEIAVGLSDLNHAKGMHASGIFISDKPLDGNVPIELSSKKKIVTSFDMDIAAQVAIKVDILGIRTLNVLQGACDLIGIKTFHDIDWNHPSIYEYYAKSNLYYGLFQIEEGATKEVVKKVKPRNIDHLGHCLALSRPGAMKYTDDFAVFVNEGKIKPIHPAFDAVLGSTGNILIYQEQVNRVLQEVYGLSAVDSEEYRRAIGKKVREDLAKLEPILYANGKERNIPEEVTKYFWDVCNASADYLFNAAHSTAYSFLTAYTTYLKANHPKEFFLALLKMSKHEQAPQEVISKILFETRQMGIELLPPDIIKSQSDFAIDVDGNMRFGLTNIRGISDSTMSQLASFRREFINKFEVFEAAKTAKVNIGILVACIYTGCLQSIDQSRAKLALEAQTYNLLTDKEKVLVHSLSEKYNGDLLVIIKAMVHDLKNEKGKPLIKESRYQTIKTKFAPYWHMYCQNSKSEELCSYIMERHFLGFSYTSSIFDIFKEKINHLSTVAQLTGQGIKLYVPIDKDDPKQVIDEVIDIAIDGVESVPSPDENGKIDTTPPTPVPQPPPKTWRDKEGNLVEQKRKPTYKVVAFVDEVKKAISQKSKEPYYKFSLYDDTGVLRALLLGADRGEECLQFNGRPPDEGDIVLAEGSMSDDRGVMFCNSIIIQPNPITLKKKSLLKLDIS